MSSPFTFTSFSWSSYPIIPHNVEMDRLTSAVKYEKKHPHCCLAHTSLCIFLVFRISLFSVLIIVPQPLQTICGCALKLWQKTSSLLQCPQARHTMRHISSGSCGGCDCAASRCGFAIFLCRCEAENSKFRVTQLGWRNSSIPLTFWCWSLQTHGMQVNIV